MLWRVSGSVRGRGERAGGAALLWPRLLQELSGEAGGGWRQGGELLLVPKLQDESQQPLRACPPACVRPPAPLRELQEISGG